MLLFSCSELLAGALAKLGRDVYTACEDISDREDEDQLNEHFQLVLAKQSASQFKCLRPLRPTDNVFPYFVGKTENSLFVTLKQSVTAPTPGTLTHPLHVIPHWWLLILVSVSSTNHLSSSAGRQLQLQSVSVTTPVKSSAYQTKKVSVEMKLVQLDTKGSQRMLSELSVLRQISPRIESKQKRLSEEVTFPLKQKSETSRIAKLKKKFKKTFFHSSSRPKEDRGMEAHLSLPPEQAWEQQLPSDLSIATKTSTTTALPTATSTTAAGSGSEKKKPRRHSHDQPRRGTVKFYVKRRNTFNANKSTSKEETDVWSQ